MDSKTVVIIGGIGVGLLALLFLSRPGSSSGSTTSPLPDLGSAGFLSGINNFPGQDWLTNFETAGSDLVNTGKKVLDSVNNLVKTSDKTIQTIKDIATDAKDLADKAKDTANAALGDVKAIVDFPTTVANAYNATIKFLSTPLNIDTSSLGIPPMKPLGDVGRGTR
jgi:hypothetical protein